MVSADYAGQVAELLELCDGFLRIASPAVRVELARYLTARQPTAPDSYLLIDLLGLTALSLQAKLAAAAERQTPRPSP